MVELSPSILSANFSNVIGDIQKIKSKNLKMLHLDVMDGIFVNNISFGFKMIEDLRKNCDYFFDTHLMIHEPLRYIERFKEAGSDLITIHVESTKEVSKTIDAINSLNIKSGITLRPSTNLNEVYKYLDKVDLVLVMSVEPGFGGQGFIEESHDRIKKLRKYIDENNLKTKIEVDGGIKSHNVSKIVEDGADIIVSGSDIFSKDDINKQIETYYDIFKNYK
ncbi:MAG: ribulose-phosphate 3-epimerase [Tissierellia bacterium]|nr:ribulose-phosphate 3-epimerase [Tissierellia bacterium]